jgi:hypothetical protein
MANTTLPLVVLMWLCQLQEYFYKISDTNLSGDWNSHGKYCPIKNKYVSKDFPLEKIHMSKANDKAVTKIESVEWIKPDSKNNKKVVKSLEEWAAKILCWDKEYVKNKAKADDETKIHFDRTVTHGTKQYAMMDKNYKPTNWDIKNSIEIVKITPAQLKHKTQEELFLHLGDFMKEEIEKWKRQLKKKCKPKNHQIAQQCK